MTTTRQGDQLWVADRDRRAARHDLFARHVARTQGPPLDLLKAQVRPLGADHYRVNVMTGDDPTAVRIPHSYFVAADEQGNILASTPAIRKEYV